MSYSASDLSEHVAQLLTEQGYVIYQGDGYTAAPVGRFEPAPHDPDSEREYEAEIDGFWFSNGEAAGPTQANEMAAWADALADRLGGEEAAGDAAMSVGTQP